MQDGSGKIARHSTIRECPAVLGIAGTELEEHPWIGHQTLQYVSLDSPYVPLGLGPLPLPHHSQLCMGSCGFKRALPHCHTHAPTLELLRHSVTTLGSPRCVKS